MRHFFLALFLFSIGTAPAWAQDFDDFGGDDKSAEKAFKKKRKKSNPLYEFWKKSVKGTIGSTRVIGPGTNRGYSFFDLRLDHTFTTTNTKVVMAGIFEYADVKVDIKLDRKDNSSSGGGEEEKPKALKRSFKYTADTIRPNEIYIKQDLFKILSLSYGYQKVVLGQFDPFSPSNFAMPWNLSSLTVGFNKTENTLPQQVFILDFYPLDQVQLSLYYFPELTYDRVVREELDQIISEEVGDSEDPVELDLPSGSKEAQKMARLMFYPSWGTIGLNYYDGYHSTFPVEMAKIKKSTDPNSYYIYEKVSPTRTFAKNEMYSIEMAIPVGRVTYKAEYARHKDLADISSSAYDARTTNPDGSTGGLTPEADKLVTAIKETNGRSINIPYFRDIAAVGFTADFKHWYINLMLLHMSERYEGNAKKLKDLEAKAKESAGIESDDGDNPPVMPGLITSYYFDAEKEHQLGFGAGIIGASIGAMLFYQRQTDSLGYGTGLQAVQYIFGDQDTLPEDYELDNSWNLGFTFNLSYTF